MRLSVTVGFRILSHAHRPHLGLTACSCSYGRAFAPDCFRAEYLATPALSFATVVVTISEHFVSYVKFMPMPGTRGALSSRPSTATGVSPVRRRCCLASLRDQKSRPSTATGVSPVRSQRIACLALSERPACRRRSGGWETAVPSKTRRQECRRSVGRVICAETDGREMRPKGLADERQPCARKIKTCAPRIGRD